MNEFIKQKIDKDPFLDTFSTGKEFRDALESKTSVSLGTREPLGVKGGDEYVVYLGSDRNFYVLNEGDKGITFIQTTNTLEEAREIALSNNS